MHFHNRSTSVEPHTVCHKTFQNTWCQETTYWSEEAAFLLPAEINNTASGSSCMLPWIALGMEAMCPNHKSDDFNIHRTVESFDLEGDFKSHLVQLSCNKQRHLQLDHVAHRWVQLDLESIQEWGFHHISEQHVPGLQHPHCKKDFLYIQSKSPFF